MKNMQVISSDIDGADLRRKKARNKYYSACRGKDDDQEINEAVQFAASSRQFLGLGENYERIFGK